MYYNKKYPRLNDREWLKNEYTDKKRSATRISQEVGCCCNCVCRALVSHKIKIRSHYETQLLLTPDLFVDNLEIMNGLLLGDGCICRNKGKNASLHIVQTNKDLVEYLKYNLCPSAKIYIKKGKSVYREDLGYIMNNKDSYMIIIHSINLNSYRNKWYPEGIKIVPKDLVLTPLTVTNWFLGDGSTSICFQRPQSINLTLCTDGFIYEDVLFLNSLIKEKIGIYLNINKQHEKYRLRTGKKEYVQKFLDYMGPCHVKSMEYKWKYPVFVHGR